MLTIGQLLVQIQTLLCALSLKAHASPHDSCRVFGIFSFAFCRIQRALFLEFLPLATDPLQFRPLLGDFLTVSAVTVSTFFFIGFSGCLWFFHRPALFPDILERVLDFTDFLYLFGPAFTTFLTVTLLPHSEASGFTLLAESFYNPLVGH